MKKKIIISISLLILLIVLVFATKETKTVYSVTSKIKIVNSKVDIGVLQQNAFKKDSIEIIKEGNKPLLISSIKSRSKAIVVDRGKQIFQKDTIFLSFLFQPKKLGRFKEVLTIHGNFPEEQLTVTLFGEVVE